MAFCYPGTSRTRCWTSSVFTLCGAVCAMYCERCLPRPPVAPSIIQVPFDCDMHDESSMTVASE
eukprot:2567072-Lingulodinium_polyedra.AAC.1